MNCTQEKHFDMGLKKNVYHDDFYRPYKNTCK